MTEKLDWIQEGVEVVVWYDSPGVELNPKITTITKVNLRTFRVGSDEYSYRLQDGVRRDGYYSYHTAPVDSDKGREVIHRGRIEVANGNAFAAYDRWNRDKTNVRLVGRVVEAFTALEQLLHSAPRSSITP